MDDPPLLPIGELARRTGLTVKAIRFYADRGIVPASAHSPAGHRLYDPDAAARLRLVRSLRSLDIDLVTVRAVLAREMSVAEVAAVHAAALDTQIRTLRLNRAVLRAVAAHGSNAEEMEIMHELARGSQAERRRHLDDFIGSAFGGVDANPALVELLRATMPELPDDPAPEQLRAWAELVELVRGADFRAAVRRMAEYQAAERAAGDDTGLHGELSAAVTEKVGAALAAGVAPDSAEAAAIVGELATRYAGTFSRADDAALRGWMLERLAVANDPRTIRYWQLVEIVNGLPPMPDLAPVFAWFAAALRSSVAG
ncbi:MerR family transcriptional regulator [Nocardia jiangsuensis]|uniref:MerR family transcriptional regulator n=1 Tax=Nocardia jiangsuensis TaxID=1691563 RepID=A0ABV8DXZ6_9NOCA